MTGNVFMPSDVRVGVLDQIPRYPDHMTVEDVLRTSFYRTEALRARMDELERRMAEGDKDAIRDGERLPSSKRSAGTR